MTEYTIQLLNQSDYAKDLKGVAIFQRPPAGMSSGVETIAWTNFSSLRPSGYDFAAESNYVFRINMRGNTSAPAPAAIFRAQPDVTFDVAPGVKFHVADGFGTEGATVEVKNVSNKGIEIDSAGLSQTTVTADGLFPVK